MMRRRLTHTSGVYIIRSISSDRAYIGSSIDIKRRFSEHLSSLRSGCHSNIYLQRHVDKYGAEDLEFLIVEFCNDLIIREQYWMDRFNPEFNGAIPRASRLGVPLSEEAKRKLSISQRKRLQNPILREKARQITLKYFSDPRNRERLSESTRARISRDGNPMKGRHHSDETKKRISMTKIAADQSGENNPMYGRKHSEETKEKIRIGVGDQSGENNPMYGRKHSEETKEKIRTANRNITDETRRKMSIAQKKRFAKKNMEVEADLCEVDGSWADKHSYELN
jgi:group I intron endonuclease